MGTERKSDKERNTGTERFLNTGVVNITTEQSVCVKILAAPFTNHVIFRLSA